MFEVRVLYSSCTDFSMTFSNSLVGSFPYPQWSLPAISSKGWRCSVALLLLLIYLQKKKNFVLIYYSVQIDIKLGFCLSNFLPPCLNSFFVLSQSCPSLLLLEVLSFFSWSLRKSYLFTHISLLPHWLIFLSLI